MASFVVYEASVDGADKLFHGLTNVFMKAFFVRTSIFKITRSIKSLSTLLCVICNYNNRDWNFNRLIIPNSLDSRKLLMES